MYWPLSATKEIGLLDTKTFRQIADCDYWLRMSEVLDFVKVREFLAVGQDHDGTKRHVLAETVSAEFRELRARYAHFTIVGASSRLANALRWRREWLALLLDEGWPESRGSWLAPSWREESTVSRILRHGPVRRYPLHDVSVNVLPLQRELRRLLRELEAST